MDELQQLLVRVCDECAVYYLRSLKLGEGRVDGIVDR